METVNGKGVDMAVKFGNQVQSDALSNQASLFGGAGSLEISEPELPVVEQWSLMEKLVKSQFLFWVPLKI